MDIRSSYNDGLVQLLTLYSEDNMKDLAYELNIHKNSFLARKPVYGIGVNDSTYVTQSSINGTCPYYQVWKEMLRRCYSKEYHTRKPTYIGCSVCKEWQTFSTFKKWMETQDWKDKQIDKDLLLPGNKIYSPETCLFVSNKLNMVLTGQKSNKDLPTGVSYDKNRHLYRSTCSSMDRNSVHLGRFKTVREAHNTYRRYKAAILQEYCNEITDIRLLEGLKQHINKLLLIWETPSFKVITMA